ncbi:MAG TPA: diaminopimelate epimerase, partial [Dialister sp.]|nr:diaminopimelate epimerase [Dialister sp.]
GSHLEVDAHFPKKANIEFVQQLDIHHFRMRVWERGTGITMACGTGTCATVVAAILNGLTKDYADVDLDGGTLHIEWDGNPDSHVFMTGPAVKAFEGEYEL